jgi:hypothetical protein
VTPLLISLGASKLAIVLSVLVAQVAVVVAAINGSGLTGSTTALFWGVGAGLVAASLHLGAPDETPHPGPLITLGFF